MVTYELPCVHDKHNQKARQKRSFVLVQVEVSQLDDSYAHCDTHYGYVCV
jgi:hypothetical protein